MIWLFITICGAIYLFQEARKRSLNPWKWAGYGVGVMLAPIVLIDVIAAPIIFTLLGVDYVNAFGIQIGVGLCSFVIAVVLLIRVRKALVRKGEASPSEAEVVQDEGNA